MSKEETKGLELVVDQLRRDLTDSHKRNEELVAFLREVSLVSKEQLVAVVEGVMCHIIVSVGENEATNVGSK